MLFFYPLKAANEKCRNSGSTSWSRFFSSELGYGQNGSFTSSIGTSIFLNLAYFSPMATLLPIPSQHWLPFLPMKAICLRRIILSPLKENPIHLIRPDKRRKTRNGEVVRD